ncbi:MAG TPA: Rieske 2Fe-2S domain-containing protein [Bryobacteraceae bacterium]|jgi:nitrite reductase (NADH) small subunit|nr:Rieske 2Fe-2S domain-containing protein [Bryobacteraceae bacterium]
MTKTELETLVAPLDAIPCGEGRTFEIAGKRLAIFHTRAGRIFATQAECPHKNGPLADGLVGGTTLICPLHGWKFDLASGSATLGDCGITRYPARVDSQGRVLVNLAPEPA